MTVVDIGTGESIKIAGTHEVAELFPMLDADDIAALAADIEAQGVLEPVTVDPGGLLLDGRNRIAAARTAKVDVPSVVYEGDPVAFILGKNMARRDMTKGQKAMIAARAVFATNTEQQAAAKSAGVSQPTVAKATTVLSHAPEVADQVVAGKRTLDDAYKVAKANKAAAARSEELLAEIGDHAPDLAEKVAAGDLELAEAHLLLKRRQKEAEQAAQDRTRTFSDAVCQLGALLDFDDPAAAAQTLVDEWRPGAVRMPDVKDWLTPDGLNRVAKCLVLTAERWESPRG